MRYENYIFPGFSIIQDDEYFKLSQDSVLLGHFCEIKKDERFIDLGCGVGVLAIMALLRNPGTTAVGVEITEGAADLARENAKLCRLSGRLEIMTGDLRALPPDMAGKFDAALSNPPYFEPGRGFVSPSIPMAAARDQTECDINELCAAASRALKTGGRLYLCYPPASLASLFSALSRNRLEPKRMRLVHPEISKPPCLALICARKAGGRGLAVEPPLIIAERGRKTEEYYKIYHPEVIEP